MATQVKAHRTASVLHCLLCRCPLRCYLRVARFSMGDALPCDLRLVLVRVRAVKAKSAHQLSLAQAASRDISSLVRDGLLRDCHTRNVLVIVAAIP